MSEIREATWDDLDAVVALSGPEVHAEHVRQRWQLPGYDRGWVAVDDGSLVGFASLDETQHVSVAAVEPADGDALLQRAIARAQERGFGHVTVTAASDDSSMTALARRNGFTVDREILRMWCALDGEFPEPDWPGGVSVRTYAAADGERVHAFFDAAYGAWDRTYVARPHAAWLSFMTEHKDFDPTMWFLVERDEALVACALHWRESGERGWLKDLAVLERERGLGLGTGLLRHAFRIYASRGVTRVGLKVDSTNPTGAPRLYERLGFVTDQRLGVWIKRL